MAHPRSPTLYSVDVADPEPTASDPKGHRTVDRVTQILEEVVYQPGISFAELARALDAPKSSVHGFLRGLLAKGWIYEDNRRFYLGPAVHALTLASGQIRAGQVTQSDLDELHDDTGMTVFLGVQAGDHLIYIGESGTDAMTGFAARSNIRRALINTAGGKALLAAMPDAERDGYLRRQQPEHGDDVSDFLGEFSEIRRTGIARNFRHHGAQLALASVVHSRGGDPVAAAVLVGQTTQAAPREDELRAALLRHVQTWSRQSVTAREPI
jgi:DNA-binding IclR family transcriptional regulator